MPEHNRPPLWKQFLGAAVGGCAALALYSAYSFASPHVEYLAGMLITPQARVGIDASSVRTADTRVSEQELLRIASRAQQIAQQFGSVSPDVHNMPVQEERAPIAAVHPIAAQEPQVQPTENIHAATATPGAWHADPASTIEEPVFYTQGGELASAGLGLWIVILAAIAGAALCLRKRIAACVPQSILR